MTEILNQLGTLVLGSVPTIILFILLIVAYGVLVRRPLDRILAERYKRTLGAVEEAKGAISAAEAETLAYEEKLRAARAQIFQAREQRLKQWNAEREQAIAQAKALTQQRVLAARLEIEQAVGAARKDIDGASAALSEQILRAVLPVGVASAEVAR
jgi:F-type H+-transporting ATPase subunit b